MISPVISIFSGNIVETPPLDGDLQKKYSLHCPVNHLVKNLLTSLSNCPPLLAFAIYFPLSIISTIYIF
jgi:hypothetical protein